MTHNGRNNYRRRRRPVVVVVVVLMTFVAPSLLQSTNVVAANTNTPSISVRPRRFTSVRQSISLRRRLGGSEEGVGEKGGLTLGDLDQLMHEHQHQQGDDDQIHRANNIFLNAGLRSNNIDSTTTTGSRKEEEEKEASSSTLQLHPNLRSSLRRIHLDLSGRVLCHVFSPPFSPPNQESTRKTTPLFTLPLKNTSSHPPELQQCNNKRNNWQRFIPHLYLGADYDLDEVWYGATRWISRCSWGPFRMSERRNSRSIVKESNSIEDGNDSSLPTGVTTNAWNSVKPLPTILFPSSKSSAWIIDLEGEQSVFDGTDSTCRVRLIQSQQQQQSTSNTNTDAHQSTILTRQIAFEYDSPKYYSIDTIYNTKRKLQYSPTLSMDIQTPFLHRRIHLHTKKTWILKEGGDKYGNYYNGDYYTNMSNAVDRRWKNIKERYRDGIPKSNLLPSTGTSATNAASAKERTSLRNKLSNWLENDGWMPRRITTNLMGNLVSVSEVGLWDDIMTKYRDEIGADSSAAATAADSAVGKNPISKRRSWQSILSPIHNAGIRLRISKKIDYTTLGIFPWSNNNARSFQSTSHGCSNTSNNNRGWMEALQSTHVRLELCGLYGLEEEKCASIGLEGDPLDWNGTYKFTFGHEGVTILGK